MQQRKEKIDVARIKRTSLSFVFSVNHGRKTGEYRWIEIFLFFPKVVIN